MRHANAAGVTFEWHLDETHLHGRMSAQTTGWVTIGFNTERDLAGTRLLMGRVRADGTAEVEEHIADPPNHRPKTELGGRNIVSNVRGEEQDGVTTIEFSIERSSGDEIDIVLDEGIEYYVTFAWSRDDDFYHHSAQRSAIDIRL